MRTGTIIHVSEGRFVCRVDGRDHAEYTADGAPGECTVADDSEGEAAPESEATAGNTNPPDDTRTEAPAADNDGRNGEPGDVGG